MEQIQTTTGRRANLLTDQDVERLQEEVIETLMDVCQLNKLDVLGMTMNQWSFILRQLYKRIFKPRPELLCMFNQVSQRHDPKGGYILPNVEKIYTIYRDMCTAYNKLIGINGFCDFIGADTSALYRWAKQEEKQGRKASRLLKILQSDREASLASMMVSDRGNSIKYIAILNHEYGWNLEKKIEDVEPTERITLSDLPKYALQKKSDNLGLPDFEAED